MANSSLLDVSSIQVAYARTQALFDVSLTVEMGQSISILGRNGMGKSTVIKAILGMVGVSAGTVRFRGEAVTNAPSFQIANRGIGLVPEGRRIISTLSVEENVVAFARTAKGEKPRWNLDRIYKMFPRLKERRNSLGKTLSRGEQQMLAIGRALATNPKLLILDEATEGLAPSMRDEIWVSLKALKAEGLAMLVVDKNLGPLLAQADKHFIIEKGRTVWKGSSDDFRSQSDQLQRYLTL